MSSLSSIYSSGTATASLISAFMMKSKAGMLDTLFASAWGQAGGKAFDTFELSAAMPIMDASFFGSMMKGGNMAVFGTVYQDAAGFNESLMQSVAASAGMSWDWGGLTGGVFDGLG